MLLNLLGPLKWYILGVIAIGLFSYKVAGWREDSHQLDVERTQHVKDINQCNADKLRTQETQIALQSSYDAINARLSAAKRLQSTCVVPSKKPNSQQAGAQHAGGNGAGISSDWLLEYAATCERYRTERIALESFINEQ